MITFYIDELAPCLRDTITGDIIDTEVVRIKRKSFLSKFNKKTGWYISWAKSLKALKYMPLSGHPYHFITEEEIVIFKN